MEAQGWCPCLIFRRKAEEHSRSPEAPDFTERCHIRPDLRSRTGPQRPRPCIVRASCPCPPTPGAGGDLLALPLISKRRWVRAKPVYLARIAVSRDDSAVSLDQWPMTPWKRASASSRKACTLLVDCDPPSGTTRARTPTRRCRRPPTSRPCGRPSWLLFGSLPPATLIPGPVTSAAAVVWSCVGRSFGPCGTAVTATSAGHVPSRVTPPGGLSPGRRGSGRARTRTPGRSRSRVAEHARRSAH